MLDFVVVMGASATVPCRSPFVASHNHSQGGCSLSKGERVLGHSIIYQWRC